MGVTRLGKFDARLVPMVCLPAIFLLIGGDIGCSIFVRIVSRFSTREQHANPIDFVRPRLNQSLICSPSVRRYYSVIKPAPKLSATAMMALLVSTDPVPPKIAVSGIASRSGTRRDLQLPQPAWPHSPPSGALSHHRPMLLPHQIPHMSRLRKYL